MVMRARSGTVREILTKHHAALQPEDAPEIR
jgi:hypothetical protein